MLKLYTDAATKGNPGPSGAGILIVGHGDTVELSTPLAVMTNHQAEFQAAALGLQAVIDRGWQHEQVALITDSQIVVDAWTNAMPSTLPPKWRGLWRWLIRSPW